MADTADMKHAPQGYSPEMDGVAHEETYDNFVHFTAVSVVFVLCCVAGLAVGGVKHAWLSAITGIILAHVAATIGFVSPTISWRAPAAVLALLLFMLLLY